MKKKEVLVRIQEAATLGKKSLDLRGCRLRRLPPEVSHLTNITHLDLSFNTLSELPEGL